MSDLLPCPFCGGADLVYNRPIGTAGMGRNILCKDCRAEGPLLTFESGTAHEKWNTRTPDPRLTVAVEALEMIKESSDAKSNASGIELFQWSRMTASFALAKIGKLG